MNDVLMLFFLAALMFLGLCLIQSIRRMAASDSRRIRRCRQVFAVLIVDVILFIPSVKQWTTQVCIWLLEAKESEAFREVVFVKRNFEVQYFLLFYMVSNLLILAAAFILFSVLEKAADRGGTYSFRTLTMGKKILHFPWILADMCYENRLEGSVLKAWAAVFGKWMWNLSDVMLLVLAIQAVAGCASLFIRIDWLNGVKGAEVFSGWYLLPSIVWMTAVQIGGFLEYCPKERPDHQTKKKVQSDLMQEKLFSLASSGASFAVTRVSSDEWLYKWLYVCFQERKRIAVICHTKEQECEWREKLYQGLSKQYDRICLIRFGGIVEMQNQQDIDILILTLKDLISLEIDRVFPFWYQQMQAVILADTHGILSHVGKETDVFFSLWKRKIEDIQYLFFECFGNAQEKQALEYFVQKTVETAGEEIRKSEELFAWELDSQRGQMRRMLLFMQQEQGVSEAWLDKKKQQFGMPDIGTEQFLMHAVNLVFEEYKVQNLYDSFLFIEEGGMVKSNWNIKLTDQGLIELLNRPEEMQKIDDSGMIGMSDTPAVCMEDRIFRLKEMTPLALGIEQEKKRLMLYQAVLDSEKRGVFAWPEIGGVPDFTRESYYECSKRQEYIKETTVLRVMLPMRNAADDAAVLSALFSVVCNQVLLSIFPYHTDAIRAGCVIAHEGRSMFCRIFPEKEYMPLPHCVTVDLIETQSVEQGLTAVLRRNSKDFFRACSSWLERAKDDLLSKEHVLFEYAQKQLGKEPDEYKGAQKLLGILGED